MPTERLSARLRKDRPTTSVTVRIPLDVIESMKTIAPLRGFAGYQTLLKAYLSDGLRKDEARFGDEPHLRLIEALKRRGVPDTLLAEAEAEIFA
jgi:hypothetical protein